MNGGEIPSKRDSGFDKISNLPSHVVDQILSRLPIRDAVRTSVLSSIWRFKWTTIPTLVFDKDCFSFTPGQKTIIKKKLATWIDYALLLHTGPISKFMLYQRYPITTTDIDRWILHLSRCLVQEFILEIWEGPSYKVNSCLFSFQDLVHLDLYRCHLKLPSTFAGFKKLKRLLLKNVTMAQDVFETLMSSCPILEELTLFNIDGLTYLNIDAPNLLGIDFLGYADDMNFVNTSNLATVSIDLVIADDAIERTKARDHSNLLNFFSGLPRIRRLTIKSNFLEYLATGDMRGQPLSPCPDLGYLELEINIDEYVECIAAWWLLGSCPNLKELEMKFYLAWEEFEFPFWESQHNNFSFNKLETVKISGISGNKNELEFIRFMLLASPVLKKMIIKHSSENQALQLATELLRFHRASTKAEVVFVKSEVFLITFSDVFRSSAAL